MKRVSMMEDHDGWVYFKRDRHGVRFLASSLYGFFESFLDFNLDLFYLQICQFGCNFWHWEYEYILYFVENEHYRRIGIVDRRRGSSSQG